MAIDDLLDEHEQSERVLAWLRRNGAGLISGILLGLAAIGGWKWWQNYAATGAAREAAQYQSVIDAIQAKDKQAADKLKSLDGAYHTLASLELAKWQVAGNQRDAAIATLRGVKSDDPALAEVVQQRLARLLVDAKQGNEAVKLLADATSPTALIARGDAFFSLGQKDKARDSYTQALSKLDEASPQRRILELKLIEAGGKPAKPEAKS